MLSHPIEKVYGVGLGAHRCQRLFNKLGFRLRKPRPVTAKADNVAQTKFRKLRVLSGNNDIEVWSLDECHFQKHGSRCMIWVPPEDADPIVLHEPQGSISVFLGQFV